MIVVGFALALVAVIPSSPAIPLGLAAAALGAWALYRFPFMGLLGLLLFYPFFMWLDAVFFSLLPGQVELLASVGKEVVLGGLLMFALLTHGRRMDRAPAGLWWVLVALVSLVAVLALVPVAPIRASILEARFHLEYLFLLPIALLLAGRERDRRRLVQISVFAALVVAAGWLSVLGWVGLSGLEYAYATTALLLGEGGGPFDAINTLGSYLGVVLLLLSGLWMQADRGRTRTVLLLAIAFIGWAMLATFSRRAVLGVGTGLMVLAVLARHWRLLAWSALATGLVVLFASRAILARFSVSAADATGGVSIRMQHIHYTLEQLDPVSLFIGHGVGTAGVVSLVAGVPDAVDLHNYYLLLLYETGLVGLVLYLMLAWLSFRGLRERFRGAERPFDRGLALGAAGALVGFLVMGLFGSGNAALPAAPLMWALIGAGLATPLPSTGLVPPNLRSIPSSVAET